MSAWAICVMVLAVMLAGHQVSAAESVWRVADRIDVDKVPSAFPVGFSLLTRGGRQYVAYYDAEHRMTVGARALGERQWQLVKLDSKIGWDSHNGITMTTDANGDLHLSGNMHCVPLIYFRTQTPGDITTFKRLPMTGKDEKRCTYPHFLNDAAGRLIFHYRDGGSGNGRFKKPQTRAYEELIEAVKKHACGRFSVGYGEELHRALAALDMVK